MKFPKFYKILDETTVEVDTDFYTTVERLQSMQGICRETDGNQYRLQFTCDNKGRMRVDALPGRYSSNYRLNFVVGEVTEQDGKTAVKIYCIHDRSAKTFRYVEWGIDVVLFMILLAMTVFSIKQGIPLMRKEIIGIGAAALVLFILPFRTIKDEQNESGDIQTMKTEMLNRIHAVNCWDK